MSSNEGDPQPAEPFNRYGPFEVHSPEWYAHRELCVGASEVASILGAPDAFATPIQVWAEKRRLIEREDRAEVPEWLHFGLLLEPVIAKEFCERTPYVVEEENQQFISLLYPFLGCSLDRWYYDKDKTFRRPLELKNTSGFLKAMWEDEPPLKYQIQAQAQLAVTGCDLGAIAVLIGGNQFKWAMVERNQRFIDAMLERVERFWGMVQNDEMPEAMGKDNRFIGQLLGKEESGKVIVFAPEIENLDEELAEIKAKQKELKARQDEIEAKIKRTIGDAERGVFADGSSYTFKTQQRKGYVVQESEYRVLRRTK